MPDMPRTMTIDELADALGIGRTLARRLAREDAFPAPIRVLHVGRRLFVSRVAVDTALNAQTQDELK